jgi:hypothetical protein
VAAFLFAYQKETNMADIEMQVINNTKLERVQLFFTGVPSEEIRKDMKMSGWHWSPSNKAWQRMNTENGLNDAERIKNKYFPAAQKSEINQISQEISANEKFNIDLQKYIDKKLPPNYVFSLGKPAPVLQGCGFPQNDSIELSASHLTEKIKRHGFNAADIKNLVNALNDPIAVFRYGDSRKAQNVIVELEHDNKKFVTGIHFNQTQRGTEVSDIRGLFQKDNQEWINWINQGKMIYGNKEKIQSVINQQRINLVEVEYLELDSIKNILQSFHNVNEIFTEDFPEYAKRFENKNIVTKPINDLQGLERFFNMPFTELEQKIAQDKSREENNNFLQNMAQLRVCEIYSGYTVADNSDEWMNRTNALAADILAGKVRSRMKLDEAMTAENLEAKEDIDAGDMEKSYPLNKKIEYMESACDTKFSIQNYTESAESIEEYGTVTRTYDAAAYNREICTALAQNYIEKKYEVEKNFPEETDQKKQMAAMEIAQNIFDMKYKRLDAADMSIFLPEDKYQDKSITLQVTDSELATAKEFIPYSQYLSTLDDMNGEESDFYKSRIKNLSAAVEKIKSAAGKNNKDYEYSYNKTTKTHDMGLHYFASGSDWYITEYDGHDTMFGYCILNGDLQNAEWGDVSLEELMSLDKYGLNVDYYQEDIPVELALHNNFPEEYPVPELWLQTPEGNQYTEKHPSLLKEKSLSKVPEEAIAQGATLEYIKNLYDHNLITLHDSDLALFESIKQNDAAIEKYLLSECGASFTERDKEGKNALNIAAEQDDSELVDSLLEAAEKDPPAKEKMLTNKDNYGLLPAQNALLRFGELVKDGQYNSDDRPEWLPKIVSETAKTVPLSDILNDGIYSAKYKTVDSEELKTIAKEIYQNSLTERPSVSNHINEGNQSNSAAENAGETKNERYNEQTDLQTDRRVSGKPYTGADRREPEPAGISAYQGHSGGTHGVHQDAENGRNDEILHGEGLSVRGLEEPGQGAGDTAAVRESGQDERSEARYRSVSDSLKENDGASDGIVGNRDVPEPERAGGRGSYQERARESGNGYVEQQLTPGAIRQLRTECLQLLGEKTDDQMTESDKHKLSLYEGAGGLHEGGQSASGVLSEFYTPKNIIEKVQKLAFKYAPEAQTVLEPAAGTGRFAENINNKKITMYELDPVSSRIARILHPDAVIYNEPYQKQFFDESGRIYKPEGRHEKHDIVMGNPPYGDYIDKYKGLGEGNDYSRYEEYFIGRGLDALKENGILAYVVPSSFLSDTADKGSVKKRLAAKGKLIDAYRLPEKAFPTTETGTDIIILQKSPQTDHDVIDDRKNAMMGSSFFEKNQDHILGITDTRKNRWGRMEPFIRLPENTTLQQELDKINSLSNSSIAKMEEVHDAMQKKTVHESTENKPFPYKPGDRLSAEQFAQLYGKSIKSEEFKIWKATTYNGYVDISKLDSASINYLKQNESNYIEESEGKYIHKSLYATGNIYKKLDELEHQYEDFKINGFAENNNFEAVYKKKKEALAAVIPAEIPLEKIHLTAKETMSRDFIIKDGDEDINLQEGFIRWATHYNRKTEDSIKETKNSRNYIDDYTESGANIDDFTDFADWGDVVNYMDEVNVVARSRKGASEEEKRDSAREAAHKRADRKRIANILFDRYLHEGLTIDNRKAFVYEWNRRNNSNVRPDYTKLPLSADGLSAYYKGNKFLLHDQQVAGASFLVQKGNGLLAYDVGLGKTAAGIIATKVQTELGRAKKPLIIVPRAVYKNWIRDLHELFPGVHVKELGNFGHEYTDKYRTADGHGLKIEEGSISVCTKEALDNITFTDESLSGALFEDYAALLGETIDEMSKDVTDIGERDKAIMLQKISEKVGIASKVKDDRYIFWEKTGFDHVTIDEAHNYRNLFQVPRGKRSDRKANEYAKMGSAAPSGKAVKLFGVTQLVQRQNNGSNVFMLTATPFTNSPLEVYSMLSYMARSEMKDEHIYNIRDFLDKFANVTNEMGVKADGTVDEVSVVKSYNSLPVLQNLLGMYMDKKTAEQANILRPERWQKPVELEMNDIQQQIVEYEINRMTSDADWIQNGGTVTSISNMLVAMVSPALCKDKYPDLDIPPVSKLVESSPKLKFVCDAVAESYRQQQTEKQNGGQIIYMPYGKDEMNYVKQYLIEKGMPADAIGIINSSTPENKREDLKAAFNDEKSELKVIIGSPAIKEGIDLNGNTFAEYNLSLGWNPGDTQQIEGRLWRQGNLQGNVHVVYPLMRDSIDAFMFQKHHEKMARINDLWSATGDKFDIEEINPDELRFDLIRDPSVKADVAIREETKNLRMKFDHVKGLISRYDSIEEKRIENQRNLDAFENYKTGSEKNLKEILDKVQRGEDVEAWEIRSAKDSVRDDDIVIKKCREKREKINGDYEKMISENDPEHKYGGLPLTDAVSRFVKELNDEKRIFADEINSAEKKKPDLVDRYRTELKEKKVFDDNPDEALQKLLYQDADNPQDRGILKNIMPFEYVKAANALGRTDIDAYYHDVLTGKAAAPAEVMKMNTVNEKKKEETEKKSVEQQIKVSLSSSAEKPAWKIMEERQTEPSYSKNDNYEQMDLFGGAEQQQTPVRNQPAQRSVISSEQPGEKKLATLLSDSSVRIAAVQSGFFPPMYEKDGRVIIPGKEKDYSVTKKQAAEYIDSCIKAAASDPGFEPVFADSKKMPDSFDKLLTDVFPASTKETRQERYAKLYGDIIGTELKALHPDNDKKIEPPKQSHQQSNSFDIF